MPNFLSFKTIYLFIYFSWPNIWFDLTTAKVCAHSSFFSFVFFQPVDGLLPMHWNKTAWKYWSVLPLSLPSRSTYGICFKMLGDILLELSHLQNFFTLMLRSILLLNPSSLYYIMIENALWCTEASKRICHKLTRAHFGHAQRDWKVIYFLLSSLWCNDSTNCSYSMTCLLKQTSHPALFFVTNTLFIVAHNILLLI